MDVYILNEKLESVAIIDDYISFIWTERYYEAGDFEMVVPANRPTTSQLQPYFYVWQKMSETLMVIEHIAVTTDVEDGDKVTISGRSLEALLDWRLVMDDITFGKSSPYEILGYLIDKLFLNPSDPNRKTDILTSEAYFKDGEWTGPNEDIKSMTYSREAQGETAYSIVMGMCKALMLGIKVVMESGRFLIKLYQGTDRSYKQNVEKWIVYSPKFNNLISTEFTFNGEEDYTFVSVCGEEESQTTNPTTQQVFTWPQVWIYFDKGATGLKRKELFLDCSDVSRWQGDYIFGSWDFKPDEDRTHGWKKLPEFYYKQLLEARAKERLAKIQPIKYDAEADDQMQWKLGKDTQLGDIVQVTGEYGYSATCRITEIILSHDVNGMRYYPTFISESEEALIIEGE